MNAQAEVLIRAMVMAAKADGQITRDEQEAIVKQLGDLDQEEINFLQTEFCLLYTSPSPRDRTRSRMPSSA